ncbi:MAG: hypothetical protein RL736_625 [Pseudomonadota bacterium]|jgi:hypothetical protein
MEKYVVKVINVFSNFIPVEATSEDEAREKAKEIILNNENQGKLQHIYENTLPPENWGVITQDQFNKMKEEFLASQETEDSNIITPSIITP